MNEDNRPIKTEQTIKPPHNSAWNQGLELARGVAVILVVYSHGLPLLAESKLWQALNSYSGLEAFFKPGWWGVRIFFALSGYLIGKQAISALSAGGLRPANIFLLRRWIRTVPTYWLLLGLACSWSGINWLSEQARLNGAFLQTAYLSQDSRSIIDVAWSLVIEEWSYAAIGVALLVCALTGKTFSREKSAKIILWLTFMSCGWSLAARIWAAQVDWITWDLLKKTACLQLDALSAGLALASIEVLSPTLFRGLTDRPKAIAAGSAAGMSVLGWWLNHAFSSDTLPTQLDWIQLATGGYILCNIAAALFICSLWKFNKNNLPQFLSKGLSFYAATSYSLYLVHLPIAKVFEGWGFAGNAELRFAAYFALSSAAGAATWLAFEKPFLAIRKYLRTAS